MLEYFSSTHGARKGLADTALKTADSGYLTRKLADVAQNVVVTMHDCGTTQGITKGVIYRGEKVEVRLADAVKGRVSRQNIVNPVTDEVIVRENEMITTEIARRIESLGLEKIQVRSPMTCDASLGVCRCCYGMDLSTGNMVEEGMAVGIIAAQSIGEPGTQLTMRTFHIGGTVNMSVEESETRAKKDGFVRFTRMRLVRNAEGNEIVLTRNGEISILDAKGRELEKCEVPTGAVLMVKENQEVKAGAVLCQWDPHSIPILAEISGKVRYEDVVEGETLRIEQDQSGHVRRMVMDLKGDLHPQIVLEDADGKPLDVYYLPERAYIEVSEGDEVHAGSVLAKTPREASGITDITGGLPRVTEIFEARKPKDPAVIAEVDGIVEISGKRQRGKRTIVVRSETGIEREHLVSHGKRFLVHAGDFVKAGQALVDGPLVPHDILRVSGEEAVQQYLLHEIQQVYRSQRVEINDKHIEIIIARMLRKVRVENAGDTSLLPGLVMDRFEYRQVNRDLAQCVKIAEKGDSEFEEGAIVPVDAIEQANAQIERLGRHASQGSASQAGRGQHPAAGYHQGRRAELQLHLGCQFPGNDQSADRSRLGRQGRQSGRVEGKRDPGPLDSRRHRVPHLPGVGSPVSARSAARNGDRRGSDAGHQLPAVAVDRQCRGRAMRRTTTREAAKLAAIWSSPMSRLRYRSRLDISTGGLSLDDLYGRRRTTVEG